MLGNLCTGGNAAACKEIRLHDTKLRPHSFGKNLYFNGEPHPGQLAHEVFHYVDQYKSMGPFEYYVAFGILHAEEYVFGKQLYNWEDHYDSEKGFYQYGLEEQGQIVEDCYNRISATACEISPYQRGP